MNPINWISFIFVTLQVLGMHRVAAPQPGNIDGNNEPSQIAHGKQPDTVSPLVMLIYFSVDEHYQTTYTDLETAKKMDLRLPLDDMEPKFIVVFCPGPAEEGNQNDVFIVRDVIQRVDSNTEYTCERYSKPLLRKENADLPYQFGFNYKTPANPSQLASESSIDGYKSADEPSSDLHVKFKEENNVDTVHNTEGELSNNLYAEFIEKYDINREANFQAETYLSIYYDFERLVPVMVIYGVIARMRSDDNDVKCRDMKLGMEAFTARNADFDFDIFSNEQPDYNWRQLVTARDFKGIYTTAATCTYLTYVLVHNDVVENWQRLETSTRKVADVIDCVMIVNGTYVETAEVQIAPAIPTLLWKLAIHVGPRGEIFAVLIVVHNKVTGRVCDHGVTDQGWGWPEHHHDDGRAGTMYYCRIEETLIKTLSLPPSLLENAQPFDLRKITVTIDVLQRIRRMENSDRDR